MTVSIFSNPISLRLQRGLASATDRVAASYAKLSSGSRINRPSDDAAGLAVSSSLRSSLRVHSQAIRNANDAISLLNIADGATQNLASILFRLKELATQSANGSFSTAQRRSLDAEAAALTTEFNRTIGTTTFNGLNLLGGDLGALGIQLGYGTNSLSVQPGNALNRTIGSGVWNSGSVITGAGAVIASGDVNGDGHIDRVSTGNGAGGNLYLQYGNGDGSFAAAVTVNTGISAAQDAIIADMDGDGRNDIVVIETAGSVRLSRNTGNGTFSNSIPLAASSGPTAITAFDANNDGDLELLIANPNQGFTQLLQNDGNLAFSLQSTPFAAADSTAIGAADFDGDGNNDVAVRLETSGTVNVYFGNGDGTFGAASALTLAGSAGGKLAIGDFNRDGRPDIAAANNGINIFTANGNRSFTTQAVISANSSSLLFTAADINGDGISDLIGATTGSSFSILSRGDGTFDSPIDSGSIGGASDYAVADFNEDGILDVIGSGFVSHSLYLGAATDTTTLQYLNLYTQAGARSALSIIDSAIDRVTQELGRNGAEQSRLSSALNTLGAIEENYAAADSRIRDVDVAEESASLTRNTILSNTSAALLAQANQAPKIALGLLDFGV